MVFFIELHSVAGSVHDHHAEASRRCDHLVHSGRHSGHPLRGHVARVSVPHIANDDGGLSYFPVHHLFRNANAWIPARVLFARASMQTECSWDFRPIWHGWCPMELLGPSGRCGNQLKENSSSHELRFVQSYHGTTVNKGLLKRYRGCKPRWANWCR
jgi:hypothetical protein